MKGKFMMIEFEGEDQAARDVLGAIAGVMRPLPVSEVPLLPAPAPAQPGPERAERVEGQTVRRRRRKFSKPGEPLPPATPTAIVKLKRGWRPRASGNGEPAGAATSRPRRGTRGHPLLYVCDEKPGTFTGVEAASLAGVGYAALGFAKRKEAKKGRDSFVAGGFHFRIAPDGPGEATPRRRGDSMPLRPMAAAEKATPRHIAAHDAELDMESEEED